MFPLAYSHTTDRVIGAGNSPGRRDLKGLASPERVYCSGAACFKSSLTTAATRSG